MNLPALQHLARAVRVLADDCEVITLGSSSLLASFPELGEKGGPLASTFDADFCPQPFDETTALMIKQALGDAGAFHLRHGYHADILRDTIFETLPSGWRGRLVPVPGCLGAFALDPHDLAATKLLVGRDKDVALVRFLGQAGLVSKALVEQRLDGIPKTDRLIVSADMALRKAFGTMAG